MIVYSATNRVNGKKYICITTRTLRNRINDHHASSTKESSKFYNAIRKYGKESFQWEAIDSAKCSTHLQIKEMQYIRKLYTIKNGYNTGTGGDLSGGWKASDELRKRLSDIKQAKLATGWRPKGTPHTDEQKAKWKHERQGSNHPAFGRKHTDEEKMRISIALKGKPKSATARKNLSLANRKYDYDLIYKLQDSGLSSSQIAIKINGKNAQIQWIIKTRTRSIT